SNPMPAVPPMTTTVWPNSSGSRWRDTAVVPVIMRNPRLESRDRSHDLLCPNNGTGVVRDIDVEGRVHLFVRIIRGRVSYYSDLVAELRGVSNGRFDAGMCYQSDHDEPMDAVFLE